MEKEIIIKEFTVLVHFDGPKRNEIDIRVKCALLCTHQPGILFKPIAKGMKVFMPFPRVLV